MSALTQAPRGRVGTSTFLRDVVQGLRKPNKQVPCKYFYDRRGSELFERICRTPEYYLTRTEMQILSDHAPEICDVLGHNAVLVEFGSGSSTKTRVLLDHLASLSAYVPVDISADHLHAVADELAASYPATTIAPVVADFTAGVPRGRLPSGGRQTVVFFSGSTIGNLSPNAANRLLRRIARLCGPRGGLLIGIDLQKETDVIESAYNDGERVTEAFNLNLLRRINSELNGDFDCSRFRHHAVYEPRFGRMRLSLVSRCFQTVSIGDRSFEFSAGEPIVTEHSHKYKLDDFRLMAGAAGLTVEHVWTDSRGWFAVIYCGLRR
jgi:dimethylhistidine N-methyltransferase